MVAPLRNSMGMYSIWIAMLASCMVLVTAARIRPMARNAQTPSEHHHEQRNPVAAAAAWRIENAPAPTISTSTGRYSSQPLTMDATRMGSGEMGVTLKRRRILASRSCTRAHAGAPQSVAQNAHGQHGAHEIRDALRPCRRETAPRKRRRK